MSKFWQPNFIESWKWVEPLFSQTYLQVDKEFKGESFNKRGFDVKLFDMNDTIKDNYLRLGSGLYISYINYKHLQFGNVSLRLNDEQKELSHFHLSFNRRDVIEIINFSLYERKLPQIVINNKHQSLQSCVDEVNRLRLVIVDFFS